MSYVSNYFYCSTGRTVIMMVSVVHPVSNSYVSCLSIDDSNN